MSLGDCSSCWPSLVDSTAREYSVDPPVVMAVIVVMSDAIFSLVIPSWGLGCCSSSNWAALSTTVGWAGADGSGRRSMTGPSTPQAEIFLDLSAHSLARARVQLAPYRKGWPLQDLPHFEHPLVHV